MKKHREEIFKIISHSFPNNNPNTISWISRIIELYFRQQIDELEEWSNEVPKNKIDKAIPDNELKKEYFQGYRLGFEEALSMLKRRY